MDLPKSLEIHDKELLSCLEDIKYSVKKLWDSPLHYHYTNHAISHSEKILSNAIGPLLEEYPDFLNEKERFILAAAAYLHDIGMQSPVHAGLPYKPRDKYTPEELEQIREVHHISSDKMICESIMRGSELRLGLDRCKDYAELIGVVARHHRKQDMNKLEDEFIAGKTIRLRLLSALLRLGDALDLDFERVNIDNLKLFDIPAQSKFHWWSHYYVMGSHIEKGHIRLHFRFPEEYRDKEVIEIIRHEVTEGIRKQVLEVFDILDNCGMRLYRDIDEPRERFYRTLEPLPEELYSYINENYIKSRKLADRMKNAAGLVWAAEENMYTDDARAAECLDRIMEYSQSGRTAEAMQEISVGHLLTMAPMDKMRFWLVAGNVYYDMGKPDIALMYYNRIMAMAENKKYMDIYKNELVLYKALALGNIGLIYRAGGKHREAEGYFNEALDIDRRIGFRQGEANQLGNMGLLCRDNGDMDNALRHFEEALRIHRQIDCRQGEASDLGNIGLIYRARREGEKALQYHMKALDIDREIGCRRGEAMDMGNIGLVYYDRGEAEKALSYHLQALDIYRELGDRQEEASILSNIGLIYRSKGDTGAALSNLQQALDSYRVMEDRQGEALALGNIGLIHRGRGDTEEALRHLLKAQQIMEENNLTLGRDTVENMIREIRGIERGAQGSDYQV